MGAGANRTVTMGSTSGSPMEGKRSSRDEEVFSALASARALVDEYQRSPWQLWPIKKKDPERMKAYARLSARLIELEELLPPSSHEAASPVSAVLRRITKRMNRDLVWDVAEQLKVTLLAISPVERLSSLLESELALEASSAESASASSVRGQRKDGIRWSVHFAASELRELAEALRFQNPEASKLRTARARLAQLYEARVDHWRHERAFIQLRTNYLHAVSGILAGTLVLFGWLIWRVGGPVRELCLAGSAGVLGAVFSGLFKVRDEMASIRQLRSFSPILIAQPLVGATAAVVVFLAFRTGIVRIGSIAPEGLAWHHHGILGFLAGFSEAFLLGIVGRLAAAADDQPKPPRAAKEQRV